MYIASLIFGIIALITCWIPVFGLAVTAVSLIMTIIAFCIKKPNGKGFRIAGLVLTLVALVVAGFITYSLYMVAEKNKEIVKDAQAAMAANDLANVKNTVALTYANGFAMGNGIACTAEGEPMTADDYYQELLGHGFGTLDEIKSKYKITVSVPGGAPQVEAK